MLLDILEELANNPLLINKQKFCETNGRLNNESIREILVKELTLNDKSSIRYDLYACETAVFS